MVIEPAPSPPRIPVGTDATDAWLVEVGKVTVRGTTSASASIALTSGRFVVTWPGSDASEKDQPPPTARIGRGGVFSSAFFIASAMSSASRGKNMRSAMYACVLDQFCQK